MNNINDKLLNIITFVLGFAFLLLISVFLNKDNVGDVDFLAFIGAILGGVITLVGVYYTIRSSFESLRKQNEHAEKLNRISNRSYMTMVEFLGPFNLYNVDTSYKSRIILTKDYDEYCEKNDENHLKSTNTTFFKFSIHGNPEIVLDTHIKIFLKVSEIEETRTIESHIGVIEKNEEIFIPLYIKNQKTVSPVRVEIEYNTLLNEKIYFLYDLEKKRAGYWLIEDGEKMEIFNYDLRTSVSWEYPNRIRE